MHKNTDANSYRIGIQPKNNNMIRIWSCEGFMQRLFMYVYMSVRWIHMRVYLGYDILYAYATHVHV
jgi:hypothetical protein